MSTVLQFPVRQDGRVPADTFPIRLAIVRADMGWNYDQAQTATGINSETWRLWEKGKRHCTTMERTCRSIAAVTGFSYEWLMVGGRLAPYSPPDTPIDPGPTNPCLLVVKPRIGTWERHERPTGPLVRAA